MSYPSAEMRAFRMFTVETGAGVDLTPPVTSESAAIELCVAASRVVRGSVAVNSRFYGGLLDRFVGSAFRGEFVRLEA